MARIRPVKIDLWTHEELSELPAETHILAAALLPYADDEGYFNANPKLIQAAIFPLRELSLTIHGMLSELSRINYVRLFEGSDGKSYGHICKFLEHQVVNRATPSKIKQYDSKNESSVTTHGDLTDDSRGKGRERKGKEGVCFSERSGNLSDSDCGIGICTELSFSGLKLKREVAEAVPIIRTTLGFADNWQVFDFLPAKWRAYEEANLKYRTTFERWLSSAKWKEGETARVNGKPPERPKSAYELTQEALKADCANG